MRGSSDFSSGNSLQLSRTDHGVIPDSIGRYRRFTEKSSEKIFDRLSAHVFWKSREIVVFGKILKWGWHCSKNRVSHFRPCPPKPSHKHLLSLKQVCYLNRMPWKNQVKQIGIWKRNSVITVLIIAARLESNPLLKLSWRNVPNVHSENNFLQVWREGICRGVAFSDSTAGHFSVFEGSN